jgi:hypothetical protein
MLGTLLIGMNEITRAEIISKLTWTLVTSFLNL